MTSPHAHFHLGVFNHFGSLSFQCVASLICVILLSISVFSHKIETEKGYNIYKRGLTKDREREPPSL